MADQIDLLTLIAPTIQDLFLKGLTILTVPLMPKLRKLRLGSTRSTLVNVLKQSPNLEELSIFWNLKHEKWSLVGFLEALKCTPRLTKLYMHFGDLKAIETTDLLEIPTMHILPKLQELKIRDQNWNHSDHSARELSKQFLGSISSAEVKKLDIPVFWEGQISHLDNLESLMSIVKECPKLVELRTDDRLSFSNTMMLAKYLASSGRQLTFNGGKSSTTRN